MALQTVAQIMACGGKVDELSILHYIACLLQSVDEGIGDISGVGGGEAAADITWLEMETITASGLTGAYAVALADTNDKRYVEVYNGGDEAIIGSWDGVTDHFYLGAGSAIKFEAGSANRVIPTALSLKHAGTVPTQGNVYISAYY